MSGLGTSYKGTAGPLSPEHIDPTRQSVSSDSRLQTSEESHFAGNKVVQTELNAPQSSLRWYVPLSLSGDDRLLEPCIIIENDQFWEDRTCMQSLHDAYWQYRGLWKKRLSQWGLWPGNVLNKIEFAKACRLAEDPS
jgi:hypothetical protein